MGTWREEVRRFLVAKHSSAIGTTVLAQKRISPLSNKSMSLRERSMNSRTVRLKAAGSTVLLYYTLWCKVGRVDRLSWKTSSSSRAKRRAVWTLWNDSSRLSCAGWSQRNRRTFAPFICIVQCILTRLSLLYTYERIAVAAWTQIGVELHGVSEYLFVGMKTSSVSQNFVNARCRALWHDWIRNSYLNNI